jgi:hypothetical protein
MFKDFICQNKCELYLFFILFTMKFIFCSIVLLLSYSGIKSQTSVYHPFPETNAVWNTNYYFYCFGWGFEDDYYSYTIGNDTIIASTTYHTFNVPLWFNSGVSHCTGQAGYKGAFRHDASLRQVFIIPPGDSIEQLLYDFDLQLGDTCKGYLMRYCPGLNYIVDNIDSVLIDNQFRKRWHFPQYLMDMYIIEGIGSSEGLLEWPCTTIATDGPQYKLTCFQQNGILLYQDSSFTNGNCNVIINVNELSVNNSISITNSESGQLKLVINDPQFVNSYIFIYNSSGRLLFSKNIINGENVVLSDGNYSAGIYYYKIINPSGKGFSGKFIQSN